MNIRLLALDLDGTLLNSRGELSQRTLDSLQAARALGVEIAVATGRRFRDALPIALQLGVDAPVISHNGALIKHAGSLEVVSATLLPLQAARAVVQLGRRFDADAMVSTDPHGKGVLVYDRIGPDNRALARYIEWSQRIHGDEAADAVRLVPSLDDFLDHAPVHISFSGSCAQMASFGHLLAQHLGDTVKVFSTVYPRLDFTLLDILHPHASKGTGLAATAAAYGIGPEAVMACGDNFNDLEMLQYAGTAVLMENADLELKRSYDFFQTASNDADGVALAIDKFILHASD